MLLSRDILVCRSSHSHHSGLSDCFSGLALFAFFGLESVDFLLVNNFANVGVWSEPNVFSSHELLKARRQVNLGLVFKKDFIVVGVFLAAEVVLLGFFVPGPLWEVG